MGTSPEQASNMLEVSDGNGAPQALELTPELRMQLTNQLVVALRAASEQTVIKADRDLRRQQIESRKPGPTADQPRPVRSAVT